MGILPTEEKEKLIKEIAELQSKLDTQNSYIDYANKNLEKLQKENKDFCRRIETLTKDNLMLNAEKQELNASLSDVTLKSNLLQKQHRVLNEKHNETVSKLTIAEETNVQLQNQVLLLQQSLADMENSRSWKLTKPLRAIKWWLWRIFKKGKSH